MRIAFIVDSFPILSETFILNQITGLIDLGHEVEIFSGARPTERDFHNDIQKYDLLNHTYYHNDKPSNKWVRFIEAAWLFFSNAHKNPKAIFRSLNFLKYGRNALSLTYFYKAILFVCIGRFDIIQCHFGPNGNLGVLLKELGIRGKLVTMFHGYDIRQGIEQGGDIYKKLFERGECFLSISYYNYKYLIEFGLDSQKIINHPVGIDLTRFPFKQRNFFKKKGDIVKIITIARFIKVKGLHYGIQAINQLVHEKGIRNIEYRIVGDGELQGELREMVEKYQLQEVVHFVGAQNQEGISSLLQGSDLYFLPSIAEALPVVLMEAQAVGLPVVATNVGSVAELIKDNLSGFLVSSEDSVEMANKLMYLIENPEIWKSFAQVGRVFIEDHYDIKKLNQRLVEIYQKI